MRIAFRSVLVTMILLAGFAGSTLRAQPLPREASYAALGETTRTPYGWADLCGRQPQECAVDVLEPADLHLTSATWAMLERINARVNAEIEPISNLDHWGTMLDHWDYPTDGKGDCKIYAIWKRKLLMDLGLPRQALLMTIVRDHEGAGHTILTVKTDRGEYVLDNMVGDIRPWNATGYKFVKRQSQGDPNVWVTVGPAGDRSTIAGLAGSNRLD